MQLMLGIIFQSASTIKGSSIKIASYIKLSEFKQIS